MANKSTVAGDLRRFATFVKGLTDAADTLDSMQQIDEAAAAATQQVADAQAVLAALQVQIADAERELTNTRNEAKKVTAAAKDKATTHIETAAAQTKAQADTVIANATAQAAQIVAEAQARHAALTEQVTSMGDQLLRMSDDKAALQAAIDTASDDLIAVEGKLAAARESIAKLLG